MILFLPSQNVAIAVFSDISSEMRKRGKKYPVRDRTENTRAPARETKTAPVRAKLRSNSLLWLDA